METILGKIAKRIGDELKLLRVNTNNSISNLDNKYDVLVTDHKVGDDHDYRYLRHYDVAKGEFDSTTDHVMILAPFGERNNVLGSIWLERTSGAYNLCKVDILYGTSSLGDKADVNLQVMQTSSNFGVYSIVVVTLNGKDYVALRRQGARYWMTSAYFTGRTSNEDQFGVWHATGTIKQTLTATGKTTITNIEGNGALITNITAENIQTGKVHIDRLPTTHSRIDNSTTSVLQAKAMADHNLSGDHDTRYVRTGARSRILTGTSTTEPLLRVDATDNVGSNVTLIGGSIASNTTDRFFLRFLGSSNAVNFSVSTSGLIKGTATEAQYADLAEKYLSDKNYEIGTIISVGGEKEVTETTKALSHSILGAVSDKPAYLMNKDLEDGLTVALTGRIPVKVIGIVKKGDRIVVSHIPGVGEANNDLSVNSLGLALEDSDRSEVRLIEVVVK